MKREQYDWRAEKIWTGLDWRTESCFCLEWTTWSDWKCYVDSCGLQMSKRVRFCLTTDDDKQQCQQHNETEFGGLCEFQPCVCECMVWAPWTSWSGCNCPFEKHNRHRTCSIPAEDTCPTWQSLNETETKPCINHECCCTDWEDWGAWSECSVTCGRGTRQQHRECRNPLNDCQQNLVEIEPCAEDHCDCPGCPCLDYSVYDENAKNCRNICNTVAFKDTVSCQVQY